MEWITVAKAFEQKIVGKAPFENMIIREIATKRVIAHPELIMLDTNKVIYCPSYTDNHIVLKSTEVEYLKED
jgi:hypothetical protein